MGHIYGFRQNSLLPYGVKAQNRKGYIMAIAIAWFAIFGTVVITEREYNRKPKKLE